MRCPKCGENVYSHHQEIYWTKTKIMRRYGCRNCHHKFRTIERILGEIRVKNKVDFRAHLYKGS